MSAAIESTFVPYAPGRLPGRRWLVLAPHPDDETFGPGATLALAAADGVAVRAVIVTDGGAQGDSRVRRDEALAAAGELGIPPPAFWDLPDRSVAGTTPSLAVRVAGELERFDPDLVLVTSPVEFNPDHRGTARAVQLAMRRRFAWAARRRPRAWVACFEISTPIQPNVLVDASAGWEAKRRAVARYGSQLAVRPYDSLMESLGTFRTLTLSGVERAEAFRLVSARRLAVWSYRRWTSTMGVPLRWRAGRR